MSDRGWMNRRPDRLTIAVSESRASGLPRSRQPHARRGAWACGLMVLLLIASATGRAQAAEVSSQFDRWYALLLQGQHIGWSHVWQYEQAEQMISEFALHLEIRRGQAGLTIQMSSRFAETSDGTPLENRQVQDLGLLKKSQTIRYRPDGMDLVIEQGGQRHERQLPLPDQPWLPPAAAARYIEQQVAGDATEIRCWMIDPMGGLEPFESRMTQRGSQDIEVGGKVVPALVWDTTVSVLPGIVSRLYTDEQGRELKSVINVIPGMKFELVQADKAVATMQIEPPELLASTLVRPDKPITDPRRQQRMVYRLKLNEAPAGPAAAGLGLTVPQTGCQQVKWHGPHEATVRVALDEPVDPCRDLPNDSHLQASSTLNHADPKIRQLVDEALGQDAAAFGPADKAERLRRFVGEFIRTKDLAVGFATASEVARTAQGDCTEHGVLLAAMLRAAGIPSRTVGGLIYVERAFLGHEGVFGYHMWTQAWLPATQAGRITHRWVDLDATLANPFDAAHIGLAIGSMDDANVLNELVSLVPTIGRLTISVLESTS